MMAVVGILCMLAFSISAVATSDFLSGGSGSPKNELLATSKYGEIYASDLAEMNESRKIANMFMAKVMGRAIGVPLNGVFGSPGDDASLVESHLLAEYAQRDLGMVMEQQTVVAAIPRFVEHFKAQVQARVKTQPLDETDYREIIGEMRIGETRVLNALRREFLAQKVFRLFQMSRGSTPDQRWGYFRRSQLKAEAEVHPVYVDNFIDKVAEPSEDELREFFEKYQDREPEKGSAEPGFKTPARAVVQYFEFNRPRLIEAAKPEVTEEEILARYAKDRDTLYTNPKLNAPVPTSTQDAPPLEGPKSNSKDGKDSPAPEKTEPALSDSSEKPAETSKSGDGDSPPSAESDPQDQDSGNKSTTEPSDSSAKDAPTATETPAQEPNSKTPGDDDQSSRAPFGRRGWLARRWLPGVTGPLALASIVQGSDEAHANDGETPAAAEDRAGGEPVKAEADSKAPESEAASKGDSSSAVVSDEANPTTPDSKTATSETDNNETEKKAKDSEKDADDQDEKPDTKSEAAKKPPVVFAPLENPDLLLPPDNIRDFVFRTVDDVYETLSPGPALDSALKPGNPTVSEIHRNGKTEYVIYVRDKIRHKLAEEKVTKQIEDNLSKLKSRMRAYTSQRVHAGEDEEALRKLKPVDFPTLAKNTGIDSGKTELVSRIDLDKQIEFGEPTFLSEIRFSDAVFSIQGAYQIGEWKNADGSEFLFWKTEDQPAFTPTFEQAKEDVETYWKLDQARAPALAAAEKLAEEARESKESLQESWSPEKTVFRTGSFSWTKSDPLKSLLNRREDREISDVSGVTDPGDEFMKAVFDLDPGEVGVAPNRSKTIYYVIRVSSREPSEAVARSMFVAEPLGSYLWFEQNEHTSEFAAWSNDMHNRVLALKWEKEPGGREE